LLTLTAMAFHGIGLEEDVRSIMEQHTRAMIEEGRRHDQDTTTRLAQQLQTRSPGSRAAPPPPPWANMSFLDMRLGKPEVFTGKEARCEEWYFKFRAYMTSMGGTTPHSSRRLRPRTRRSR
jgi:hypothetical protein